MCNNDADHDNDLLLNSDELAIGTDPCLADTDADQMSDGWEYYSAKDLNIKAAPYPGERPYPNALDPSDGGAAGARSSAIDFDGDGLTTLEEYRAWRFTGSAFDATKAGRHGPRVTVRLQRRHEVQPERGARRPELARADLRPRRTGVRIPGHCTTCMATAHGVTTSVTPTLTAWPTTWSPQAVPVSRHGGAASSPRNGMKAEPWGSKPATTCGQEFGYFKERPFASLDIADHDVDGDTLLDGEDDQDNDDISNIAELYEVVYDLDGDGGFTCTTITYPSYDLDPGPGVDPHGINAFNPCAPDPNSRTCQDWKPF